MESVKLKVGRNILDITSSDIIMDNGSCVQIITQKSGDLLNGYYPCKMAKKLFKDLKLVGYIYTDEEMNELKEKKYPGIDVVLYRFNINAMERAGY